jgi:hypothetical protein
MDQPRVKNSGYVQLKSIKDDSDGLLTVAEAGKDIPFDIKRIYYITNLENFISIRGKHAHKKLEQVLFCINGSFHLILDDGTNRETILMNNVNKGVILGKELWHEMTDFSAGCILLVLASDIFDESDYLRDYDTFLKYINTGKR